MAIAMAPIIEWVVWRLEISGEKAEKDIQIVPSHSLDIRRMIVGTRRAEAINVKYT